MRLFALAAWMALPIAGYAAWTTYGPPHLLWSYAYRQMGNETAPFQGRYYTSCTYIAWGFETDETPARGGKCPVLRFFHAGSYQ